MICIRKTTKSVILTLWLLFPMIIPSALGEPAPKIEKPLNLTDCIQYALSHHGDVLSAEQNLSASKSDVTVAKSGYLPRASLNSDYLKSEYHADGKSTDSSRSGTNGLQNYFEVSQTLYDGGSIQKSILQAKANARSQEAQLDLTEQERILTVTEAYFGALKARKIADIAAQTVKQSEDQLQLIQARIDTGDAAKVDRYPVDVQLANAQFSKIQADNNARTAWNTLRNAMGMTNGPALEIVDIQNPPTQIPSLDQCFQDSLKYRPEIVSDKAQVDSAKASYEYAKLQTIPVPDLTLNYDKGLGGADYNNQWSVSLNLSLSLFSGGGNRAAVNSSRSRMISAETLSDQTKKDILMDVEQAYCNLTSALQQLDASQTNVKLAETNLEVAKSKYQQGLAIPLEITTAQTSYSQALTDNAQALYDSYIAWAELNKAMGKRGY